MAPLNDMILPIQNQPNPKPRSRKKAIEVALAPTPAEKAIKLDRYVPAFFTFIAYRLSRGAAQYYQALGGIGIEAWRCLVLLKVDRAIPAHRFARELGMDKGSISRCLKRMESDGLITFALDDTDGRLRLAKLTRKGDALHDKVVGIALERERSFLSILDPQERERLIDLLARLHAHLPEVEAATERYVRQNYSDKTVSLMKKGSKS